MHKCRTFTGPAESHHAAACFRQAVDRRVEQSAITFMPICALFVRAFLHCFSEHDDLSEVV